MTARDIFNGSTGNRARILILDDATGKPKTGVAWNAAGLSIAYRINTGSEVAITLTSGNWSETGGGKYLVDVADSVYAAGNLGALVQFYGALTSSSVYGEQHRVVAYNPLAVAVGANTTTPPTAAANALAVAQYDQRQQDSTAGTIGWYFKKLRQANLAIEATVTADVTATTKTFSVNLTTYPTGAFRHAVMTVVEDSVILEQNSPIETFTNNTTFSTIVLEEELTAAPQPGDVIVIAANSHVHSIASITSGVWSALTSGLNVAGSAGRALARLIGLVEDSSGDRFTAKALEEAPAGGGGGTVNVLPAVGISAERSAGVVLNPFVGETISQAITLYQTDGTTPIDLSGKTLELVFDTRSGTDVAVVDNASITVSGTNSNTITFAYPAAVTASERVLRVALRDASAPRTVYLSGLCKVSLAPFND